MSRGTVQHIVEVLNTDGMDANKQFSDTNPLVAAIRGGKVENVQAVLDAGADINRGITPRSKNFSPFELLVHVPIGKVQRDSIARLLLDRGAILPAPSSQQSRQANCRLENMRRKASK